MDTKVGWIPMLSFVRRQFQPLWFRLVVAALIAASAIVWVLVWL